MSERPGDLAVAWLLALRHGDAAHAEAASGALAALGDQALATGLEQDVAKLKEIGIRDIFLPGTPTTVAVEAIQQAVRH